MSRSILHVDMDAFYASVEERDRPELAGRPVIVGGTGGRGVVAAANYVVRRFGVRSAMPMREALKRCPEAVCIPPRMGRYQQVSQQVFAIFRDATPLVEGLSLDEAFLDVTGSERLLGGAEAIGIAIRRRIREQTGLAASVGIASNKLLAKIASDLGKPDGLYKIDAADVHRILDPLPVERLFGIGPKTLPAVHAAGIRSCGELRRADEATLWRALGRQGRAMRDRAAGLDDRPVVPDRDEKSISAEETFATDLGDIAALQRELLRLADRTATRLRAQGLAAACVTVKIRRSDFTTYTRQRSFQPPSQDTALIHRFAAALLEEWRRLNPRQAVRLLGVGVSDLQPSAQSDLFAATPAKESRLDHAVDDIRRRFGSALLTRASLLPPGGDEEEPGHGPS